VVEVAPQYDATTNTAHAGAQMLFEILSLMVFSPGRLASIAAGAARSRAAVRAARSPTWLARMSTRRALRAWDSASVRPLWAASRRA
jgi:hypothetical protein